MNLRVFMPGASEWLCRYCNEHFWWHPGASGEKHPTQCACGQLKGAKAKTLVVECITIEERKGSNNE